MSKYTTGEVAKLCNVSVRTVQYYDERNILIPSELSEGGRRLYSEDDLTRMRIICFLREIGLPINSISKLFAEEKPQNIISILLEQQEKDLREELSQKQTQLNLVEELQRQLKSAPNFSVESIGDVAHIMKSKKIEKNALGNGVARHPRNPSAVDVYHSLDHQRSLVAVSHLDRACHSIRCRRFNLLYQTRGIHLSRMPRNLPPETQGVLLDTPHPHHAPSDLPQVRSQRALCGDIC